MKWIRIFVALQIVFVLFSCNRGSRKIVSLKDNYAGKSIVTEKGECFVEYDEFDKLTGERITEIKPERIFVFTHEKLKEYFGDRPFIDCMGSLSRSADKYFLNLTFVIDVKFVKTGYNGLAKNGLLKVGLLNNENIYLKNIISDTGERNNLKKNITYRGIFPISKSYVKLIEKHEISSLGVEWDGGVEEYEVFNIDFAIRQKSCLDEID